MRPHLVHENEGTEVRRTNNLAVITIEIIYNTSQLASATTEFSNAGLELIKSLSQRCYIYDAASDGNTFLGTSTSYSRHPPPRAIRSQTCDMGNPETCARVSRSLWNVTGLF
jgi:hypothetical protein